MAAPPSRTLSKHPIWDLISKVAAPGALVVGAACYLTGFTFKGALLRQFGFESGAISLSVQETISLGYPYIFMACLIIAAIAATIYLVVLLTNSEGASPGLAFKLVRGLALALFALFFDARNAVLAILSVGFVAGAIQGLRSANSIKSDLRSGCHDKCFYYHTKRGTVQGRALLQDHETMIIVGRSTAYIVKSGDLLSAAAIDGSTRLRSWR